MNYIANNCDLSCLTMILELQELHFSQQTLVHPSENLITSQLHQLLDQHQVPVACSDL